MRTSRRQSVLDQRTSARGGAAPSPQGGVSARGELVTRLGGVLRFRQWQALINAARGLRRSRIIMYHSFSPGGWGFIDPLTFKRQVQLVSSAYDIVGLRRHVDDLSVSAPTQRQVVLTIDDAYEDFFTLAYPILRELRVPATLFVPTGYIGRHNDWEEGRHVKLRVMTAAQLRALDPALITVGSHSVDHRVLAGLSRQAMSREASRSREELEQLLGRSVTFFAYPFGGLATYTSSTQEALRAAGYRAAVTTRTGTYGSRDGLFELRRIELYRCDTAEVLSRLAGDRDWRAARELIGYSLRRPRARAA
jgi:peptidoglycan/xylan/chitin deacetylase (PgdA/CDA1 family)